jgi:DMSO/TMAO reductase YedYZ molybdopterin-dependent catalytic subunit
MSPKLPPGQYPIRVLPRFGAHLSEPPPTLPDDPVIEVAGAVDRPFSLPVADLADLERHEVSADLHCVSGWSATGLQCEGVRFADLFRRVLEPSVPSASTVTHVVLGGLDGYRAALLLEDLLAGNVLVADRLDGRPLDGDHGAPVRLVSPDQYGYMSVKHLCLIELHEHAPARRYHRHPRAQAALSLLAPHPRARVWHEERHRLLPAWLVRPVYRHTTTVVRRFSARGAARP